MKGSCRGCAYALRYSTGWGCNYLEVTGKPRILICKVRGKDDVCTARKNGKPSPEERRAPAHKYDMKTRDMEKIHSRKKGERES